MLAQSLSAVSGNWVIGRFMGALQSVIVSLLFGILIIIIILLCKMDQDDNIFVMVTALLGTLTCYSKNAASSNHFHGSILVSKESSYYSAIETKRIFRADIIITHFVQYKHTNHKFSRFLSINFFPIKLL